MAVQGNRFVKAADQLSQAWDMATTGKYKTWRNPVDMTSRIRHIGHRLTDAFVCLVTGSTSVEHMQADIAEAMISIADEIDRRKAERKPPEGPQ